MSCLCCFLPLSHSFHQSPSVLCVWFLFPLQLTCRCQPTTAEPAEPRRPSHSARHHRHSSAPLLHNLKQIHPNRHILHSTEGFRNKASERAAHTLAPLAQPWPGAVQCPFPTAHLPGLVALSPGTSTASPPPTDPHETLGPVE